MLGYIKLDALIMTIFIVSHNLQINSAEVPAFSAAELADVLQNENCDDLRTGHGQDDLKKYS